MKNKLKSLLALLLALCMALSLCTVTVWAAEEDAGDGSISAQAEEPEVEEAVSVQEEDEEPAPEEAEDEEPAPQEEPEAEPDEPEEAEASQPEETSEPETQEQEESAEPEEAEEAQSDEVEPQAAPSYYPASLTVAAQSVDSITVKWVHGSLPGNAGSDHILLEGRDVTANGRWTEVWGTYVSNARSTNFATGSGSVWDTLSLVTRHEYEFRLCYTSGSGERGASVTSGRTTYYNKAQEKVNLQSQIDQVKNSPVTVAHDAAYDENYLIPGQSWVEYNHPLFKVKFTCTGTASGVGADAGHTLLVFRADYTNKFANNGFEESDARYIPGPLFHPEYCSFITEEGTESYNHDIAKAAEPSKSFEFNVDLNELGYGCNFLRFRMGCFQYNGYDYGFDEHWGALDPLYFNVGIASTRLSAESALTTKDTITLKPCTNYSGTLSYDDALPSYKGNVSESGCYVWCRKKGAKRWGSPKTFTGTKVPTIKKLKADTVYQWKAQYYLKSTDHNGNVQTLTAPETKAFTVCTAVKDKPKVKSCKVSGAKVVTHTIKAHTEKTSTGWKWVPKQVWYTTDFTVTFTFDKASKNIKGYTSNGVYAKAKNGKVKFKMSVSTGKKKQKAKQFTTKLQSCTNTNGPGVEVSGLSPKLKYTGKIK